jgi:hypothetical protein
MKNVCLLALCAVAVLGTMVLVQVQPAQARPPYKKQFDAKYVKKDSSDPTEKKFAEAAEAAKCNICHVGEKKKDRNEYGMALSKLLKKGDEKDIPKIDSALDTVAKEASKAGPTYGDLIKEGKLPGGG